MPYPGRQSARRLIPIRLPNLPLELPQLLAKGRLEAPCRLHTLDFLVAKAPEQGPKPREVHPTCECTSDSVQPSRPGIHHSNPKGENMIKSLMSKFWKEEDGASAIEYGLLAALIAVVIATSVGSVGKALDTVFQSVVTAL